MKENQLSGKGEILYDFKYDVLTFKMTGRHYRRSIKSHNFVADIDAQGYVTGVRIFDASLVFNVGKEALTEIVECRFSSHVEDDTVSITLDFEGLPKQSFTAHAHLKDSSVQGCVG